jgi:transcriptional regulator with XRE-family HTH domain
MKLEIFMKENNLTDKQVGKAVNRNAMTIYRYRKGMIHPSNKIIEKLFRFSKGLVAPNDFYELKKMAENKHTQT